MGKSFQEQMLALGLVNKKKAQDAKKDSHQRRKKKSQGKSAQPKLDENALLAQQAAEKKKARAQKLNKEREAKLKKRADEGRIRQLVEQHRLQQDEKGKPFRFNHRGTIRRVFVDQVTVDKLGSGQLGIVGVGGDFEIVPREIVERILEIDKKVFSSLAVLTKQEIDPDDPYAGFEVPDDLMW